MQKILISLLFVILSCLRVCKHMIKANVTIKGLNKCDAKINVKRNTIKENKTGIVCFIDNRSNKIIPIKNGKNRWNRQMVL